MPRRFVWHPGRGPATTPKPLPVTGGTQVQIRQVRSEIGHPERLRRTLQSLGLRHHQDVVVREYTPAVAGQVKQVRHLVTVTPLEA
jgi:large subunit ribosomal protein L30